MTDKCYSPNWEGGMDVVEKHSYDKDGDCILCGDKTMTERDKLIEQAKWFCFSNDKPSVHGKGYKFEDVENFADFAITHAQALADENKRLREALEHLRSITSVEEFDYKSSTVRWARDVIAKALDGE